VNPDTSKTTRTMLRSDQTTKRQYQRRKKDFLLQIPSKDIRLQILQDPMNLVLQRSRQQQRAQVEPGSGNNHVLLATTRQKTTNSDILLSSKEGHSASKTDISSTAGQPGPGKNHRHQSTQARCDPRSDADLHRTVARRCRKINSKLLDDGMNPHITRLLPPATTYYLVQCCREINLPLISITRLLSLATRLTRLTTHVRGLLYFTNYHNHGYGGLKLYGKTPDE
jgi:hypothetical protein